MTDLPGENKINIKDHPVLVVLGLCAAVAASAWGAAEKIRVDPIAEKLTSATEEAKGLRAQVAKLTGDQAIAHERDPVITGITLEGDEVAGVGHVIRQHLRFKDADGDARTLSYVVLQTDNRQVSTVSGSIFLDPTRQKQGGVITGSWACAQNPYFVSLRVFISDAEAHLSAPYDYVINCPGSGPPAGPPPNATPTRILPMPKPK
jgi:hypothetical protein